MASGLLSLKWNNHRSTFFHILSTVRQKASYCDVTLACEGKLYPVHKLVLSTCSEYFELMFENAQCKHPIVVLKDVKSNDLEALLNYMYIGEVNVLQENLPGLIKAAECLQIKGLAVPDEEPIARDNKRVHRIEESPQPKRRRVNEDEDSKQTHRHSRHSSDRVNSPPRKPSVTNSGGVNSSSSRTISRHTSSDLDDRGGSENGELSNSIQSNKETKSTTSHKEDNVPEVVLDENEVKEEPIDEDAVDDKEALHSDLGFDTMNEGGEGSIGECSSGYIDEQLLSGSVPQSVDDVVSSLPGSSGFQSTSFSMWDGDGSMQGFPVEGYSGDGSQSRQLNEDPTWNKKPIVRKTCPFCGRDFGMVSDLNRHILVHTGEKPHACTLCKYRARRTAHLQNHMFSKHGVVPVKRRWGLQNQVHQEMTRSHHAATPQ